MTVVHVYAGYVASGAEGITRNVQGFVDSLAKRGEDVRLESVPVRLSELNRLRAHARNARAARRLVRRLLVEPDVDVLHHHVNVAAAGAASRRRTEGGPRVLVHVWNAVYRGRDVHGRAPASKRLVHRALNGPRAARWGLKDAQEVVVSSQFQARQLRALGLKATLHVVPNGVDVDTYRPVRPPERQQIRSSLGLEGEPTVLYYGHLSPWKGVGVLTKAFQRVARSYPRAQLVLAHTTYGAPAEALAARLRNLGIEDRVRLLGLSHVPSLLAATDLVVVPPIAAVGTACHPNVLLEALAAGTAVVASRVGSIPEAVRDGQSGLLVDPGNPVELADALMLLADDEPLRRTLGERARQDAVARFSWDLAARRMQDVYRGRSGEPTPEAEKAPLPSAPAEVPAWA